MISLKNIRIIVLLIICIGVTTISYGQLTRYSPKEEELVPYVYDRIKVKNVINGHTIRLEDNTTLLLIGIETPVSDNSSKFYAIARKMGVPPEVIQVMGNESTRYLMELIEGTVIRVEYDKKSQNLYGMIQGYVFRVDTSRGKKKKELFVNLEMMKSGYSKYIDTYPNVKYNDLFKEAYKKAEQKAEGLWKQWLE